MIPAVFEEVLLPKEYTAQPSGGGVRGGPRFKTDRVGNETNEQRNITRYDGIRDFVISYGGLSDDQMMEVEEFFITKWGGGIAFRFFPPVDNKFRNDLIATTVEGETHYKLYRRYTGGTQVYLRRICKPEWNNVYLTLGGDPVGTDDGQGGYLLSVYGQTVYGNDIPIYTASIDWTTGDITFAQGTPGGLELRVESGVFHVPAYFNVDDFEGEYDVNHEWNGIPIREILPARLGIQ